MVFIKSAFMMLTLLGFCVSETIVSCNFDNKNFCSWTADKGQLTFKINTPAQTKYKMPKFDNTKGNYLGRYAYVQGDSTSTKNGTMTLSSTPSEWKGNFCFSFWYVMDVDDVIGNNEFTIEAMHANYSSGTPMFVSFWSKSHDYRYRWRHAYVQIKSSEPAPKMRIKAQLTTGVIAVDDLAAEEGTCPPDKICTFDKTHCDYREGDTSHWSVKRAESNYFMSKIPDHTTRSMKGGYLCTRYLGINQTQVKSSSAYSPPYATSVDGSCVTFYYHIYNVSRLSFNTYLTDDTELLDPQWTVTIGQGLLWHGARLFVSLKRRSWQLAFEVNVGSQGYGQVAIDDVSITSGKCPDPGYCDFDTENCLWENAGTPYAGNSQYLAMQSTNDVNNLLKDDFDWIRHIGVDYFGPSMDKNQGSPQGFYLLLDSRYTKAGEKAVYVSERLSTLQGACLKMWYAKPNYKDGTYLQVLSSWDFKEAKEEKIIRENTNEEWTEVLVPIIPKISLNSSFTNYWIFLAGYIGNHTLDYFAVDDIRVEEGNCEDPKIVTKITTEIQPTTEGHLTTKAPNQTVAPQRHCPHGHALCDDGDYCIPRLLLCDGIKDCPDGSDEKYGCNNVCDESFFFCNDKNNSRCIGKDRICNGVNDCGDGSDESLCDKCIPTFCINGGECSVQERRLTCQCRPNFFHNRCSKDKLQNKKVSYSGWIIVCSILAICLIVSVSFIVWYKRKNT